MIVVQRAAALALAVVTLVAALIGTPAQAVPVTVHGTTYDVQFNTTGSTGTSFNDDAALIQASPWWGSSALANDFATAYGAQVATPYPFDLVAGGSEFLQFSHSTDGSNNDAQFLRDDGSIGFFYRWTIPRNLPKDSTPTHHRPPPPSPRSTATRWRRRG